MGKWLGFAVRVVFVFFILVFIAVTGAYLWLRYIPPPSLPQSKLLAPVTEITATPGLGIITLTWNPVANTVSYQVERALKPNGPFTLDSSVFGAAPIAVQHLFERIYPGEPFGRIPHMAFVDSDLRPGRTYYYRVRANDGSAWSPQGATVAATAATLSSPEPSVRIAVDAATITGPLEHKWEIALGSEHLSYMLKGDINEHVRAAGAGLRAGNKLAHDTLGIHYVRAHGILMDDPSVYTEDAAGHPRYDFTKVDKLYDMVRADGLKPFVELSFMPSALAAQPHAPAIYAYRGSSSPPRDYAKWQALVAALARHLIDRYGREEVESWPFEVWNEPDLGGNPLFWSGTRDDYFRLYDYAAAGLKSVDPNLKVGGPVVAFTSFQEPFLRHITTENYATGGHSVPFDFLDMHNYFLAVPDYRPLLRRYGLGNVPVYYSEWGVSLFYGDKVSDLPYSAAEVIAGLEDSLDQVSVISYWTASDYFEESGDPKAIFHGGFGLIGLDNLRKPRYWAYYLLHQLGTEKLSVTGSGDGFGGLVKALATRGSDDNISILLSNATSQHSKAAGSPPLDRHITLTVTGLAPNAAYRIEHDRIDNTHSNVYGAWQSMGSPKWPDAAQMTILHQRDNLQTLTPTTSLTASDQGTLTLDFDLPMPAVSFIWLMLQK